MKIKPYINETFVREWRNDFNWCDLLCAPKENITIDFFREMRDVMDWAMVTTYFYIEDEEFIKEFLDYLPPIYRINYEENLTKK